MVSSSSLVSARRGEQSQEEIDAERYDASGLHHRYHQQQQHQQHRQQHRSIHVSSLARAATPFTHATNTSNHQISSDAPNTMTPLIQADIFYTSSTTTPSASGCDAADDYNRYCSSNAEDKLSATIARHRIMCRGINNDSTMMTEGGNAACLLPSKNDYNPHVRIAEKHHTIGDSTIISRSSPTPSSPLSCDITILNDKAEAEFNTILSPQIVSTSMAPSNRNHGTSSANMELNTIQNVQHKVNQCRKVKSNHEGSTQVSTTTTQNRINQSSIMANITVNAILNQSTLLRSFKNCLTWSNLPKFHREEFCIGDTIGIGEFGIVNGIDFVMLGANKWMDNDNEVERQFMAKHCIRRTNNKPRYAIKAIKEQCFRNEQSQYKAAVDLAIEAHFLSALDHPNIIKLRGLSFAAATTPDFFIIMDRLHGGTLTQVIQDHWICRRDRIEKGFMYRIRRHKRMKAYRQLWEDRLKACVDLTNAIKYLHSKNIMHRDLKPDNIGFDVRGDLKIFDFGLSIEIIVRTTPREDDDDVYKMSGQTGSLRYMAPEVYYNKPYNTSADVWSLGMIMWQIFALERPFADFDERMMRVFVYDQQFRPKIDPLWTQNIRRMIESAWSDDLKKRPGAATIATHVDREVEQLRRGTPPPPDDKGLVSGMRRHQRKDCSHNRSAYELSSFVPHIVTG